MHCVVCFFKDEKQRDLKHICFGIPRYENKIKKYKETYIDTIKQLVPTSDCKCSSHYTNENYLKWTNDFLANLQNNIQLIEETFEEIYAIYIDFISKNQKIALDRLWKFLETNNLNTGSENPIVYNRVLFRGRRRNEFDEGNIYNLFHISFDQRNLVGDQRFSISGQPMIYFSSSVLAVEKELEVRVDNLALSAYLPKYSVYYHKRIYELTNSINTVINNNLPGIFEAGSQLEYNDLHIRPNKISIMDDLKRSILLQLCTFPTEVKIKFVPEYVISQMLTTSLLSNGYDGLIFPSTKDYSGLIGNHDFSSHHLNIGLFVDYKGDSGYDESLLNSFRYYTFNGSERFDFTLDDVKQKIESIFSKTKKSKHNNNDYLIPIVNTKLHIEYLEESNYEGNVYFETKLGKIELEFYMKMLNDLEKRMK